MFEVPCFRNSFKGLRGALLTVVTNQHAWTSVSGKVGFGLLMQ